MLLVTLLLFPLLYLTLELPKRIINDAIGEDPSSETVVFPVDILGVPLGQVQYLWLLCGIFLLAVMGYGLLKMRINTMKGVLAERLLRRFRYSLIARMLRFPQPYFERTSQGELVSMITAESEPMGGLMGDALAQPVLQAGQMLTILGFLFAQSFAFGVAACALIPLQAWLIPRLQRQINRLNRKRVIEVRALAGEIGEGATGAGTLRVNAGWRYRLAMITDRLGRLFDIRFEIYRRKFFMKFLNNFITQLTPFFFYSIGGYLVIRGDVSIGALVAAIAAYKDLSAPWKELLTFYNQTSEMTVRWETINERFAPPGMIDDALMTQMPETIPPLTGDIRLNRVSVRDEDGNRVLENLDVTLPGGALIGIAAPRDEDRRALSELLTREMLPSAGTVRVGEHDLAALHQITIAARIGHANARPVMFQGSFGDNVFMPVRFKPANIDGAPDGAAHREALRAGNSLDPLPGVWTAAWSGPAPADERRLRNTWCRLIERIGGSGAMLRRALDQTLDSETHEALAALLIDLRPTAERLLRRKGLDQYVHRFDPDRYCPALPVVQNLLFATPRQPLPVDMLSERPEYVDLFRELGLVDDLEELAQAIMEELRQIFGTTGTDHPLFQKTGLEPVLYERALRAVDDMRHGKARNPEARALLLSVASSLTAEQVGPAFPDRIRRRVLDIRSRHGDALRSRMSDLFAPIELAAPLRGGTVLENVIFGKVSEDAGPRGEDIHQAIAELLRQNEIATDVLQLVFEVPISIGGSNLPATFSEPLAVSRAAIKRPDILVLDSPMASFDSATRVAMIDTLRRELPDATILHVAKELEANIDYGMELQIEQGRLVGDGTQQQTRVDAAETATLGEKVSVLEASKLFSGLDRKQLRLLAFGARWYRAPAGQYVFHKNDAPDSGAFMMVEGEADLLLPRAEGAPSLIDTVGPGTLVGELGLIRNETRALDMRARTDILCLRLGVAEFMAVVENDAATAFKLLEVVAGYVRT
ncbi:ABC transporter transmembrane domain-containing protein [Aliishimia ponticola]|uniref:ABC transporter transmembrane domain-containing protein n=1 Tax=Aliishimia ponticola TaxID=2499833 RepID=UPI001FEC8145|nr:ABC transporter transmembrane domain-containing protein [Aliishimia ponticola]